MIEVMGLLQAATGSDPKGLAMIGAGIAAAGGVIGALVGAGVPEEDANFYAEGVRRGGTLVMVKTSDDMANTAYSVMQRYGAVDVDQRGGEWRQSGWSRFDTNAGGATDIDDKWRESSKVGTGGGTVAGAATGAAMGSVAGPVGTVVGGVAGAAAGAGIGAAGDVAGESAEDYFNSHDSDFRSHYQSYGTNSGYSYEQYQPVYRYGYGLATDPQYGSWDWDRLEPEARRRWEERNPGTWDRFKDSVRYAWDRARGAR